MIWMTRKRLNNPDVLGFIPEFLSEDDPRPAREQIHENYAHGGGWRPFPGFTIDDHKVRLCYPGDPPMRLEAMSMLREEVLLLFEHSWLVIVQRDGTWEAAHLD